MVFGSFHAQAFSSFVDVNGDTSEVKQGGFVQPNINPHES
jgi:hypothetical protein